MAIWYLNYMNELDRIREKNKEFIQEGVGMKSFEKQYHTYQRDNRKAEVWKDSNDNWGCRFWEGKVWAADEIYKGHSETYAENAAENYVEGIKNVR